MFSVSVALETGTVKIILDIVMKMRTITKV